jgi:phytoene desaturase
MKNILIVGAGVGGLSTALRLLKRGYTVTILEKNAQAGGRMNQLKQDGFTFDTGPSFFSMSYEFEELASDCGLQLPFEYVGLDPLYTVHFRDSEKTWHLHRDLTKLAAQFQEVEPDFEAHMRRYLTKSGALFNDTVDLIIKQNFNSVAAFVYAMLHVNPRHLPVIFRTFWQQVCRYFTSREAREIISLVAFFLGKTPFDTMAVYTLLSHTEFQYDGYYNVKGGMYAIIEGFVKQLEQGGVRFVYNTEIVDFRATGRQLTALIDQHGQSWTADDYVINADAAFFRHRIFQRKAFSAARMAKKDWTMGFFTFYIGVQGKLPQVNHHNYFLGNDYQGYADKVMRASESQEKPYYYVNVVSKYNEELAPAGCESLFFVCPVPNLLVKPNWDDKDQLVDSILADFSRRIGEDLNARILTRVIYTPENWQNGFNLYKGAGLGLSHTFWQIGGFRPKNYDEHYRNVFYVGASTVPGAGIPMAVISSRLVVERLEKKG